MTNPPNDPVRCRAQLAKDCEHAKKLSPAEFEARGGWREDGTYLRSDDSIVCMSCYIALGTPNNPVIPHQTAGPRHAGATVYGSHVLQVPDPPPMADGMLRLRLIDTDNTMRVVTKAPNAWQPIVEALGCAYMDVVYLIPDVLAAYVDDTGRLTNRPVNVAATMLYVTHRKAELALHGPALFFKPTPEGDDAELDSEGETQLLAAFTAAHVVALTDAAKRN